MKINNGSVELAGTVVSAEQADLLVHEVMSVPGVIKVDKSLTVASFNPEPPYAAPPSAENMGDLKAASAKAQDEKTPPNDIKVPAAPIEKLPESAATLPSPAPEKPLMPSQEDPCPGLLPKAPATTPQEHSGMPGILVDPRPHNGDNLLGGASIYALRPYLASNVASTTSIGLGTSAPSTNTTNFEWNAKPAYAIWLGWSSPDGLGARIRWFHLDGSSDAVDASNGPGTTTTGISCVPRTLPTLPGIPRRSVVLDRPGLLLNSGVGQDLLTFTSNLRVDAVDFEVMYDWETERWAFVVAGGGRYLSMKQGYHASLINNPGDGVTSESQSSRFQAHV